MVPSLGLGGNANQNNSQGAYCSALHESTRKKIQKRLGREAEVIDANSEGFSSFISLKVKTGRITAQLCKEIWQNCSNIT